MNSKDVKTNNFKKDVLDLYFQDYTATQIATKLAKKYHVDPKSIGREFINFKSRIGMCILRFKQKCPDKIRVKLVYER